MPKESAGEAMISEETSEDENDNEEINYSSDEHSYSDDEESSSSAVFMTIIQCDSIIFIKFFSCSFHLLNPFSIFFFCKFDNMLILINTACKYNPFLSSV